MDKCVFTIKKDDKSFPSDVTIELEGLNNFQSTCLTRIFSFHRAYVEEHLELFMYAEEEISFMKDIVSAIDKGFSDYFKQKDA